MYSKKTNHIAGILITVALLIMEALFMTVLVRSSLIPTKFLIVGGIMLLLLAAIVFLLTWELKHKVRIIVGLLIAVLLVVALGFGTAYISMGVNTLESMTETTVEITEVEVYVRNDDPAQSLNDAAGYTFGILTSLDREATDDAIAQINSQLNVTINTREYNSITELADSMLLSGETQAIIMSTAFLDLFDSIEGYEEYPTYFRALDTIEIETVIEHAAGESGDAAENADAAANDPTGTGNFLGEDEGTSYTEEEVSDMFFTCYISGIDSRTGLIAKSRSDVNILAAINVSTKQVVLISTPRDFYVPLSVSNGSYDKLTHAGIYGIDCCMDTIGMLYDVDVDYYFRVNFTGFESIVDSLGGISVYSDQAFTAADTYDFVEGYNTMNGEQALAFARERYAFSDGDRHRGVNQMAVIQAVVDKAMSPAILTNYTSLIESLSGTFETSIPYSVISGIVSDQLSNGGDWNIVSYSANGSDDNQSCYSLGTNAYVMQPDYSTVTHAQELIEACKNGETLTQE